MGKVRLRLGGGPRRRASVARGAGAGEGDDSGRAGPAVSAARERRLPDSEGPRGWLHHRLQGQGRQRGSLQGRRGLRRADHGVRRRHQRLAVGALLDLWGQGVGAQSVRGLHFHSIRLWPDGRRQDALVVGASGLDGAARRRRRCIAGWRRGAFAGLPGAHRGGAAREGQRPRAVASGCSVPLPSPRGPDQRRRVHAGRAGFIRRGLQRQGLRFAEPVVERLGGPPACELGHRLSHPRADRHRLQDGGRGVEGREARRRHQAHQQPLPE
mmetsp:Transcript_87894/g.253798  ORF Transcript_87894/g.253798 Transcript_87894/m.253798 type:complete len:269 (-) Transcript_87894:1078-1884(-)